jgi:hypothetical protein
MEHPPFSSQKCSFERQPMIYRGNAMGAGCEAAMAIHDYVMSL